MAEIFEREIDVNKVVTPLIAAPELCYYECVGMDDEHDRACRDAVLKPGNLYIIACTGYNPLECDARRTKVGTLNDEGELTVNPGHEITAFMNTLLATEFGVRVEIIQTCSDDSSGFSHLAESLANFELRKLQE